MNTLDLYIQQIQKMMNTDYCSFIKALISIETGETSIDKLQALYDIYMDRDEVTLLNQLFHN